jgi:multiple sugar transport system permease protein
MLFRSLALLPVVFLVLLLAGCGRPAQEEERVVLRFTVWDGGDSLIHIRDAVEDFEAAHPDIEVKLESVTQNYQEKLLAQYAANVAPDVVMMDPPNFQRYAKRDAILSLNPFIERDDYPIDAYYDKIVEAHKLDGELYVLPRDIAPVGIIYYNKEIFDEAGLDYPDGTWTWDYEPRPELREQCFTWVMKELTEKKASGRTERWGFAPGWAGAIADTFVYSQGLRYWDDVEKPLEVKYDQEEVIRVFDFIQELSLEKNWMPSQTELDTQLQLSARQLFTRQRAAMYMSGIWEVPNIRKDLPPGSDNFFEWDITLAPAYKDGNRGTPTGGSGYAILSQTEHPDAAWELVKWMAGEPGLKYLAISGTAQPAIESMATSNLWIPDENTPLEERYPENRIATHHAVEAVVFPPSADYWPEVSSFVTAEHGRILSGAVSAEEGLTRGTGLAQDRLDTLLEEENLPSFNWTVASVIGLSVVAGIVFIIYWPERKVKYTDKQKKESRVAYLFLMPFLVGLIFFTVGPMILSGLMSFARWDIIQPAQFRGWGNFQEMFFIDPRFWVSLKVTFIYTLVAVPGGIFISLMLALLLSARVKGMPIFRTLFYLPSIASMVAASLIWMRIFMPEGGLLNTAIEFFYPGMETINWLGSEDTALWALIIMSLWGAGGGMIILLAGLQGIPEHYYEAAVLDGASALQRFKMVTIPLLSPALLFVMITGFIGSFQVFTQAFVITGGGPGDATRFYVYHAFNQAFQSLRMGYASSLAWFLFFIVLAFTIFQLKASKWVYYEGGLK